MTSERTFIIIKPEAIQRHLIGQLINKFEIRGLKLVAAKLIAPTEKLIGQHYPDDDAWYIPTGTKTLAGYKARGIEIDATPKEVAQKVRQDLIDYFKDRPVLAMVWEGAHAVALGRKTVGDTNPLSSDVGSIRGDFSQESYSLADHLGRPVQTLVHASGSVEEAEREIELWFKPEEVLDYGMVMHEIIHGKDWGRVKTGN